MQPSKRKSPIIRFFGRFLLSIWNRIPPSVLTTRLFRALGKLIHQVAIRQDRISGTYFPCSFTRFFRNPPLFEVLRDIAVANAGQKSVSIASLGCSTGAELYSLLWLIHGSRPDMQVKACGVDFSPAAIEKANTGSFSRSDEELSWLSEEQIAALFDLRGGAFALKHFANQVVNWVVGDVLDPSLPDKLGTHDIVMANNFLGAFKKDVAERSLDNISRLVKPAGYLVLFGVDLNLRTQWVKRHGYEPVNQRIEQIHVGDPSMLNWPWTRWGLEPLDKRHADWPTRYAALFQAPGRTPG